MKIKIPCSTSNLGPGFDTLGLALNRYLLLSAETEKSSSLHITVEGNGKEHIATDESNLVYNAMKVTAAKLGKSLPALHVQINNGIPAYGGGLTINCFDAERKVHCTSVKIDPTLSVIACSPHFQVQTKEARKILPQQVSLKDAVTNIENAASLVAALMNRNYDALRYVTAERLHEQYRATLIPGYAEVKKAALDAGALSFNISGAGPTVFAFTVSNQQQIADAMVNAFARNGQKATAEIMSVENNGAVRL